MTVLNKEVTVNYASSRGKNVGHKRCPELLGVKERRAEDKLK